MNFYTLRRVWKPEIFQGHGKKENYFEGWYYKLVDKEEKNIYAIIPGVSIVKENDKSHAFIQIINGKSGESRYLKFDIDKFHYSKKRFEINIKENYFSLNRMALNIKDDSFLMKGELKFEGIVPWPVKLLSPGIMGWYAFVPFMECYHGVLSLNHLIEGKLEINTNTIDFNNGIGYMEKDWGVSFPKSWIWLQSNHFDKKGISLTASVANIPWLRSEFTGFIIGLLYDNKLYRFTTYTKAKLNKAMVQKDKVNIEVEDKNYILEIEAIRGKEGLLYSPKTGIMEGKVYESLSGRVNLILYRKEGNKKVPIYEGYGRNTGLEISNTEELCL